jgi:hypothetical protein
LELNVS